MMYRKLVRARVDDPGLIDATFVKFVQQYASREEELGNKNMMTEHMSSED